ncbi:MATE family efflux transporter [Moheibacter stercoris]
MLKSLLEKFKNRENAKDSMIALTLKMSGVGLLFLLTLFLTNNFSPDLVGQYSFSRSILLILGGISIIGAEQSIIYYSGYLRSKNAINNIKSVYFKTVKLILFSSLLLILIMNLINAEFINSFFEVENPFGLVKKVTFYLFFHSIMMLNIEMFRALNKMVISEIFRNITRYGLFFIGAYILLINDLDFYLVDVYLGCFVVLCLITCILLALEFKKLGEINPDVKISTKEIFYTSYPMALNAMTFFLMQSTDVILLGKFEQFDTVAYYDTAVRVASLTMIGVMSVNVVIAPKIAELYNQQKLDELQKLVKSSIRLMLLFSTPAILFLFVFAEFVLGLFGEQYKSAKMALFILITAQYITTVMGMAGNYMNMTGKQRILHKILIFAFLLNVALNYLLIPKMGMNGSALATGITIVIWHSITIAIIYKKDKIFVF